MRLADEVQDGDAVLPIVPPESTTQLLEKDQRAFGWTKEQERVNFGQVYAFVEQVNRK